LRRIRLSHNFNMTAVKPEGGANHEVCLLSEIDLLREYAVDRNLHIIGIAETFLENKVDDAEISIYGYKYYRKDRYVIEEGRPESVILYVRCVITLLNTFLPVYSVSRHTSDKPWITDEFRRLIRCRQHAWTSGDRTQYNRLRNQVNRLSRQLRQQFYNKRLQNLRTCDPRLWWREIKRLTGQSARSESEMSSLESQHFKLGVFFLQTCLEFDPPTPSCTLIRQHAKVE
jgi:hypothetical protein